MKARGAALQGALAAAGLLVAYATWQREPEKAPGEIEVVDVRKGELKTIRYEDGPKTVELTREGGEGAPVFVTIAEPPPPPPAPKGAADAGVSLPADAGTPTQSADAGTAAPVAAAPAVPKRYRGNDAAERLFERFSSLKATRGLGVLDEEKRKEVGLAETRKRLELRAGRDSWTFAVAIPPFGLGTAYLEAAKDKQVFLVQAAPLNDLEGAQLRLLERRLHRFELEQLESVSLTYRGKTRELVRAGGKDAPGPFKLAPKEKPEAADETLTTWHDRFWRMLVSEVLPEGQQPPGGEPAIELRAEYRAKDKKTGFIEVGRVGTDLYARTEQTAGWVKLYGGAAEVLAEAPKLLGK